MNLVEIKNKYVGTTCTLDGKPAVIVGRKLSYAFVVQLNTQLSAEFAWPTVARVMENNNGEFKS